MHIGKTLLEHIKGCNKCQQRYSFVMAHKNTNIKTVISWADKNFKEGVKV